MKRILILCLIFFSTSLLADNIRLRNGQTVVGRIVAQSRTAITVQTDSGMRTIAKAQIASIQYGAVPDPLAEKRKQEQKEKLLKEMQKQQEEQEKLRREIAAIQDWQKRKSEPAREAYEAMLRRQKATGIVRFHSDLPMKVTFLEKRGDFFLAETDHGRLQIRRDEMEEMEITLPDGQKKMLKPESIEALETVPIARGQVGLASGMLITYKEANFDGYNYFLVTDSGRTLKLRPGDIEQRPPAQSEGQQDLPETLKGIYFKPGQYGYLMTLSGQKVTGKMVLHGKHELIMDTRAGLVHFHPYEIAYGRDDPSVAPSGWLDRLTKALFWD